MFELLFGSDFWFTSAPIFAIGLLTGLVVLAWEWRVSLPSLFVIQLGVGQLAVQRGLILGDWARVFGWVMFTSLLILFLSILQSERPAAVGRLGTAFLRLLLLGLAAFLISSVEVGHFWPRIDGDMAQLLLWIGFCALFAIASTEGALDTGLALLLWLVAAGIASLAVAPAALVVVLLGVLFLLVALACGYLLVAENMSLAEENLPITDSIFPDPLPARTVSLDDRVAGLVRRLVKRGITARRGSRA